MLDFKLVKLLVLLLSVVDAPPSSVNATVGDDVVLPVHLETKLDTSDLMVSWKLGDLVVHECHDGRDYLTDQNENFKGRTSMFKDKMAEGNVSLRLENVTEEDSGTYNCTVVMKYDDEKDYSVSLCVELSASPNASIKGTPNKDQSGGLIAGAIVGIVAIVGLIGLIQWCRKKGKPVADGKDETEMHQLNAIQDQKDHDDQRCPTEAPGETDPLSDPPNRDAPLQ